MIQPRLRRRKRRLILLAEALRQPLLAKLAQIVFWGLVLGRREGGKVSRMKFELDGAAVRDFLAAPHRLRLVRKPLVHRFRAAHEELVAAVAEAIFFRSQLAGINA